MPRVWLSLVLLVATLTACAQPTPTAQTPMPQPTLAEGGTTPTRATPPGGTDVPLPTAAPQATAEPLAPDTHPRLWLTPRRVEEYRAWATAANPLWAEGLVPLAERARAEMDEGRVPGEDCGDTAYEAYPTEMYAELFAFLSLVNPDEAQRADDAQRARTLLMYVMTEAAKGPVAEEARDFVCNETEQYPPFRHPDFFTSDRDRARYHGEAFALVTDWIYPVLTAEDKAVIRTVFLQWSEDIITRGYHHPEPVGVVNDPVLLEDLQQVRFAGNNYYAAHMRNLGLMALALDPADDADGKLRGYLAQATGSYLYIFDHLLATEARGGMLPEGFEYSPQTASYAAQFLWALQTTQTRHEVNREFWQGFITAYLHSLSPGPQTVDRDGALFEEYEPVWYGDAQDYRLADFISAFGPLAQVLDDAAATNALRWSVTHTAPGGAERLLERVRNPNDFREAILYFLLLDPTAPAPTDPRPRLPLDFTVAGLNRVFSRTSWEAEAAWFNYRLGWNSIDHQIADGNHFELYRNGEWLTKGRTGYPDIAEGIGSSEFYNTLTIENARPDQDEGDWRMDLWRRGSQWNLVARGNPAVLAQSTTRDYVFVTGDATNLYNSDYEGVNEVLHASRSLLWLKPDMVFVYDRAETSGAERTKRWWLQLAEPATISGNEATSVTPEGQQLFVTVLLPEGARLEAVNATDEHTESTVARDEPMRVRLMTEAPGDPLAVQFLHVLQGADAGATRAEVTLLVSEDGLWDGAATQGVVVLFARAVDQTLGGELTWTAPAGTETHYVTGLTPNGTYSAEVRETGDGVRVTLRANGRLTADAGGVVVITR